MSQSRVQSLLAAYHYWPQGGCPDRPQGLNNRGGKGGTIEVASGGFQLQFRDLGINYDKPVLLIARDTMYS